MGAVRSELEAHLGSRLEADLSALKRSWHRASPPPYNVIRVVNVMERMIDAQRDAVRAAEQLRDVWDTANATSHDGGPDT